MHSTQSTAVSPLASLAGIAILLAAGNASANDDFETQLKSYAEVPSVSSTASGRFKASVERKSASIRYELSYRNLQGEVRQAHIHLGQKGVNGAIMVFLCQTATNPDPTGLAPQCVQSGSVQGVLQAANVGAAAAAQGIAAMEFEEMVDAIRAGVTYVNVHSSTFPGGELRGQLRED